MVKENNSTKLLFQQNMMRILNTIQNLRKLFLNSAKKERQKL
jgi:hypothetical protein